MVSQNQWSVVFAGMVSRAVSLAVLSTGVAGNYNGALQVVSFESYLLYCNNVNLITWNSRNHSVLSDECIVSSSNTVSPHPGNLLRTLL